MLVELDVDDVVLLHLGDGVRGDQFGVETLATLARFWKTHWMSTTMASQAPVMMASSCCR